MTITPAPLQSGDTIGVTCPAGAVDAAHMEAMYRQLRQWDYTIKVGRTVGNSYFKFSATDKERLDELQKMLDDVSIMAIFFGRGGYGTVRIIDQLDFTKFCKNPKWLVGYSDITCLHSHIHTQYNISTLHAHMGSAYQSEQKDGRSTQSIYDAINNIPHNYQTSTHALQRNGLATGQVIGGNLALLSDLVGTKSDLDTNGKILFIEDISEYRYNIDRMMWQLLRAGKLENLAALIVGTFNDTQDNEIPFGLTEQEIVAEKVKQFKYPVCYNFPVGHQAENVALKIGVDYRLNVNNKEVCLQEIMST